MQGPNKGHNFPYGQQQHGNQMQNLMAYNQMDIAPNIRQAIIAAQAQNNHMMMPQGNDFDLGQCFQQYRQPPPQQMAMMPQPQQFMVGPQHGFPPPPSISNQSGSSFPYDSRIPMPNQQHQVLMQQQQQQQQHQHQQHQQQHPQMQLPNEQERSNIQSNNEEMEDNIDEFDQEFFLNNPGIVQSQKYFQDNQESLMAEMPGAQFGDGQTININLTNNNKSYVKRFGLNQNKRGQLKMADLKKLKEDAYSQRNEQYLNQQFGYQPPQIVKKFRDNKARLEQLLLQKQYQQQGNILAILNNLENQLQGIHQNKLYAQGQFQNAYQQSQFMENPSQQQHQFILPQSQDQVPFGKPGSVISVNDQIIQNDTLKMIRDQVKEELKEELKNQIRQELIDQLPKESKEALASKGDPSASKEEHLPMSHGGHKGNLGQPMTPSQFRFLNNNLSEAQNSNDSKQQQNVHDKQMSGQSLGQYKFGQIQENPSHSNKKSSVEKNSKNSLGSKQSPGLDSESERLRKSYDEYGKMICEKQNAMMIDYKKQSLIPINEYDDIDSEKIKDSRSKEQLLSAQKKQQRSSSLSLQNHSKDHLQRQLEIIKSTQKRQNHGAKRNNSINIDAILDKHDKKRKGGGTDGANDHIKQFYLENNGESDDQDAGQNGGYDFLQIQIEDERLMILDEIHKLVKSKNPKHDQNIDESNLNNRLKLICENLSDLDIDYSVSRLLQLSTKEKKILKGLIKKYHEILMHKNKYINVEQLDNELKSDLDDEYDDEEEEEEEEEQQEEQEDESDHSSSSKKKQKKNIGKSETDNSDNEVSYENYKPKIDPAAQKLREGRRGSIISVGSRRKKIEERKQQSLKKKFRSDDEESNEDDEGDESISKGDIDSSGSKNEDYEDDKEKLFAKSPSLSEIKRSPSYASIDSRVKQQAAMKFDPKLLRIRDNDSGRGSIRSRSSKIKKNFLQEMISERSGSNGNRRQQSLYRRDKLQGLELDYHEYLQQFQGIFMIRCQMMNIELSKIREKYDIEKMMIEFKNFKKLQKEIKQDEVYRGLQTVIIDIENTFITLIEVRNKEELDQIKELENFASDYILIKKNVSKKSKKDKRGSKSKDEEDIDICCEHKGTEKCICDLLVYLVRPYTYEILRAIQPFFEIVVFSKLHHKVLEHIIDHIESVLNKPIKDFLEKYQKSSNKSSFQRMKKLPDVKIYFQFIIHQRQYIHIKEHDKHIENLLVLTKNRPKDNLIFISSNPFRIVTAIKYGFLTIPVIQFESFYRDDYQLSLVEHYILKIRHLKDMKKRLRKDFKFLVQKIENKPAKVPTYIKNIQSQQKNFETQSQGSFGNKKLKQRIAKDPPKQIEQQQQQQPQPIAPSPIVAKKVDPALIIKPHTQPPSIKGQFKPRKSSFGNISFGDPLNNKGQPQSESDEDYDDEEVAEKIKQVENELKSGEIKEKQEKKKMLFTKIDEMQEEEEMKQASAQAEGQQAMPQNQSFGERPVNPQEKHSSSNISEHQQKNNQQDLMQYNFKEASSPKKIGNINPLYRPGLEHLEEDFGKQAIMSLKRQGQAQKTPSMNNLDIKTDSLIAGGNKKTKTSTNSGGHENLGRRYESMEHNRGGGSVIVNKGSIIVNVNKNVIHQPYIQQNLAPEEQKQKQKDQEQESEHFSSESGSQSDSSINGRSPEVEGEPAGSDGANIYNDRSNSESSGRPKIVQGKVQYDSRMIILEDSKDQSMSQMSQSVQQSIQNSHSQSHSQKIEKSDSSGKPREQKQSNKQIVENQSMHVNKSSSMISSVISKSSFSKGGNSSYVSSEIDDIYAQIDKEQKEQEQIQMINKEIDEAACEDEDDDQ